MLTAPDECGVGKPRLSRNGIGGTFLSRKITALLTLVFLLSLSGCRQPLSTTLTITMSLGEEEWKTFRKEIFPPFERQNNIRIKAYQIESGQLATKLEALQSAGRPEIDLFAQDNMNLAVLISKGLVFDLSEYENRIPQPVISNLVRSARFNGRLMFMPFRPNVQIAYYNEDAFKRYGLQPPKTWGELLTVAKRFKEAEGEGRVLIKGFGGNPTATQLYEFILQGGGRPYSFNDRGCQRTFRFLQELWPYLSEESKRAKWDTTNDILARQQAYLAQNWPFGVVVLTKEYKLPFIKTYSGWRGPAGEHHVIGGDLFGIPKDAKNKQLALKFIAYMQSREVQEILVSKLGWPSIRQDAYAQVEEWQRPHYESVKEALSHGAFRKNVIWWPAYAKYVTEAFKEIVMENRQVKETLDKYRERLEREKSLY